MKHASPFLRCLAALALVCAPSPALAQSAETPEAAAAPDPDAPWRTWTDDLQLALVEHDVTAYDALVDVDAILERVVQGVSDKKGFVKGFKQGARTTMSGGQGLYLILTSALDGGGHFDLLRLRGKPDARTALFRVVNPDGGFDYIEFELKRSRTGTVSAVDYYTASTGELVSAAVRRWMLPLAASSDRGLLERLLEPEQALVKDWPKVERAVDASKKGDVEAFAEALAALPAELRIDKLVLLMRIRVFPAEDARYVEALGDMRKHYADDPATRLHSIDWYYLRGEHDKALAEIEGMGEWADGDPYLRYLSCTVLLQAQRFDAARQAGRAAIDGGLAWTEPYWLLMTISLRQERYADTLALLVEMDKRFELEWNDFGDVEEYKGFVASTRHAEWLAYLKAKAEGSVTPAPGR
jgi:hypothetical protein